MVERPVTFNGLTFNVAAHSDLTVSPFHWIRLTNVDGYYGDDIRFEKHDIAGSIGSRSAAPLHSGKQLVLTGEIRAANLYMLRLAEELLQQAMWSSAPLKLLHHTWKSYEEAGRTDASNRIYFTVRVNQPLVIVDQITEYQYKQLWTVGMHADDPRLYKEATDTLYHAWQA